MKFGKGNKQTVRTKKGAVDGNMLDSQPQIVFPLIVLINNPV